MTADVFVPLISALTVLFLGLLQWRSATKVQAADASQKIGDAYSKLLDELQDHVRDLENRVNELEKELKKYRNWTAQLVKQLIEHGIAPNPPPDTGELKQK